MNLSLERTSTFGFARCALLCMGLGCGIATAVDSTATWQHLEPGLVFAVFQATPKSTIGDSKISVLRIDPSFFDFKLMNASAPDQGIRFSAKQWCQTQGMVAAINPSMYQKDLRSSVSLMKTHTHTNNPRLSKDNTILVFDRTDTTVPPVQIIDRQCQDFERLRSHYHSQVQSIRMISCKGLNVWNQQLEKWSTAAIGMDTMDRVLFIHCRSPYSVHEFINILLALPINIKNAMYAEGGPEAQLYVKSGDFEAELVGDFESAFDTDKRNQTAYPIPNIVGIIRKSKE